MAAPHVCAVACLLVSESVAGLFEAPCPSGVYAQRYDLPRRRDRLRPGLRQLYWAGCACYVRPHRTHVWSHVCLCESLPVCSLLWSALEKVRAAKQRLGHLSICLAAASIGHSAVSGWWTKRGEAGSGRPKRRPTNPTALLERDRSGRSATAIAHAGYDPKNGFEWTPGNSFVSCRGSGCDRVAAIGRLVWS